MTFNPLELVDDPDTFGELQVKEITISRLAVFLMFECAAQTIGIDKGLIFSYT